MQNQNLPLLSISRENYNVPKGEEQVVHYKAERVIFARDGVTRLSQPSLIKTNIKMFDEVKRNLELQGYTIEILYHPQGKYTNVVIPKSPETVIAEKEAQLEEKDEEIARLKRELADAKKREKKEVAIENQEDVSQDAPKDSQANDTSREVIEGESAPKKTSGRPKKS